MLIRVGSLVGAGTTIFLVVFTAVVGAFLVRAQGISTLTQVHASLARNELPAISLLEGALILIAGALLLTPGFITDTVGFIFLIPPWRQSIVRWLLSRQGWEIRATGQGDNGRIIEGEFSRDDGTKDDRL